MNSLFHTGPSKRHGPSKRQSSLPSLFWLGSLIALVSACGLAEKSTELSPADFPEPAVGRNVQERVTEGGFPFLHFSMPDSDRTAVAITWHTDLPAGAAGRETAPRLGIDLMLNGGAGGLPADRIIADFEDLDSGSRLWVQPQEISGFIVSPRDHMDRAAEIANLVLTQPNLDEQWFAREKKNLLDAAEERESIVAGQAWNLFRSVTVGDHPYERFWSLRTIDGIKEIELDDVKKWHANAFSTAAMSITVAGNADIDAVNAAIDSVLVDMPNHQPVAMREFDSPKVPGKTIVLHDPEAEKSILLAWAALPSHSEGLDIPLQLGTGVLGYGKQSRLFKAVRSGLRASYGFGAGVFDMTRAHSYMHMSGEVETAKLQQALNELRNTYENFRLKGISLIEFPIAKRFYLQRIREELKKPSSVAYMMMEAKLNESGLQHVPNLIEKIKSQKRAAVNQTIREKFPAFDSLLKIVVSPDAQAIEGACVITEIEQWVSCE